MVQTIYFLKKKTLDLVFTLQHVMNESIQNISKQKQKLRIIAWNKEIPTTQNIQILLLLTFCVHLNVFKKLIL